ncbi:GGDEF domain-containing protein [Pseudoalteromonas sp. NEC-BIFX-2020_002]|uniref:sensor domain-containing diguanylate cyclase n=1 Tax=Pseudoalteromonas sp. NEC-BIFX-2020_002 TaxID=2732353 RepID=UPI0014777C3E|nr:sensor domain-containing diguanylate cyclase [Pseudoalteromonas sp. NEC-BIFX-2020_002]NNG45187.1 GGDEF domain-containing protein [Pseudoalteromonas sp. NEC-BIFX-2020_002]
MKNNELFCLTDVLELMLDAVCVVDKKGHFVFVSAAFENIFGYLPSEVIGKPMIDFVYKDDHDITHDTVEVLLSGESRPRFENRWVRKDGQVLHILWSVRWSELHQVRIAVAHDITERKEFEKQLQYMVGHDQLTGLPNRMLLLDRIQHALTKADRSAVELSLLFIDIDGFKDVNDTHGHLIGDKLLQSISQRLLSCVRSYDTVGRLGGDEFVVLLNGISEREYIYNIAEKICVQCKHPFKIESLILDLSSSIGIASYPENGTSDMQLIQYADQAMYRAKNAGGNRIVY